MFSRSFKPVRPGGSTSLQVKQLQKAVSAMQNMRPGSGMGAIASPYGTAITQDATQAILAFTDGSGVSARSGTAVGKGNAFRVACGFDGSGNGTLTQATTTFPVFNLSQGVVQPSTYIMVAKISSVWFVIFEDCPSGS